MSIYLKFSIILRLLANNYDEERTCQLFGSNPKQTIVILDMQFKLISRYICLNYRCIIHDNFYLQHFLFDDIPEKYDHVFLLYPSSLKYEGSFQVLFSFYPLVLRPNSVILKISFIKKKFSSSFELNY